MRTAGDAARQALAWATVGAMLLWPALYNDYPLLYPDSAFYIALSFAPQEYVPRGLVYPLLMQALHFNQSLWPVIVAQAALTAWLLHEVVAAVATARRWLWLIGLGAVVALLSGLPWTVDQIMPDFLSGLSALALALLLLCGEAFSLLRRLLLAATIAIAVAVHPSHLAIALAVLAVGALLLLRLRTSLFNLALPVAAVVLGVATTMAVNLVVADQAYYSKGGQQFLFGRMVDDGLIAAYLDRACPQQPLALCALKDRLPKNHNDYLWFEQDAFEALGGWQPTPELGQIMLDSIRLMPLQHLRAVVVDTGRQLLALRTGESMHPSSAATANIVEIGFPTEAARFHDARQQSDELEPLIDRLNQVHPAVEIGALALLPATAIWLAWRRRRHLAGFAVLVLTALVANAFTCGVFSGVLDRYQNRIAWLAVAAVVAIVVAGTNPKLFAAPQRWHGVRP